MSEAAADPAFIGHSPGDARMLARPATGAVTPYPEPFHGRAVSWAAVTTVVTAFLIGGLALVFGPTWWLFWVATGLAAVGGLLALAVNIFDDWY
jgi:fatty acid desaturase